MIRRCCSALAVAAGAVRRSGLPLRLARSALGRAPPAGSAAERRAHARVEQRFRAAGLRIGHDRFRVPGHGRSRNVVGIHDAPADCLIVLVAHTDSVPPAPGADDNASGVGTLVALAPRLQNAACDVWLIATGAEERPVHRAARPPRRARRGPARAAPPQRPPLRPQPRRGRARQHVPPALAARTAPGVEGRIVRAGRGAVRWVPDSGTATPTTASSRSPGCPRRSSASRTTRAATPRATPPPASSRARSRACARSSSGSYADDACPRATRSTTRRAASGRCSRATCPTSSPRRTRASRADRWPERLDGQSGRSVDAHGKHLFLRFEGGLTIHSHLRMTGSWRVLDADRRARPRGVADASAAASSRSCSSTAPCSS